MSDYGEIPIRKLYKDDNFEIFQTNSTKQIHIKINKRIVNKCFDFSLEFIKTEHDKSSKSHGSDFSRPWWEQIFNVTEGKLAEVAVVALLNFVHGYQTKTKGDLLDYKFRFDDQIQSGKHNLDENDIIGSTKRVDVKAIKGFSSWLTLNGYKDIDELNMRSEIYILIKVHILGCIGVEKNGGFDTNKCEKFDKEITCSFCGWSFVEDFFFDGSLRLKPYFPYSSSESLINKDSAIKIKRELDENKNYDEYLSKYIHNEKWRTENSLKVRLYSKNQYGLPINVLRVKLIDLYNVLIN
jgi:hypothetical protein